MHASKPLSTLRNVLYLDAFTCIACGALMSLAAEPLSSATLIPGALLFYAGVSLFPIAAFMAVVGKRAAHSGPMVGIVAGGNLLWVLASIWLLVGGAVTPNALVVAFVAAQAGAVAGFTALEIRGMVLVGRRPAIGMT